MIFIDTRNLKITIALNTQITESVQNTNETARSRLQMASGKSRICSPRVLGVRIELRKHASLRCPCLEFNYGSGPILRAESESLSATSVSGFCVHE
jgi:hypothetical protein